MVFGRKRGVKAPFSFYTLNMKKEEEELRKKLTEEAKDLISTSRKDKKVTVVTKGTLKEDVISDYISEYYTHAEGKRKKGAELAAEILYSSSIKKTRRTGGLPKPIEVTENNAEIGMKVVRNPKHWEWNEQDEGSVYGVILDIDKTHGAFGGRNKSAQVSWVDASGKDLHTNSYRIGSENFDLLLFQRKQKEMKSKEEDPSELSEIKKYLKKGTLGL